MTRRWLVLGLLGALFGGASVDAPPAESASAEERRSDAGARGESGHRVEGARFYTWQEDRSEAESWRTALAPLDRPRR